MITLYGVMRSRATRPAWVLYELGLEHRQVPVIQAYRAAPAGALTTASPEVLAVNPMGQVPYLDDNGLIVTESLAIAIHLARRYGGALGPQTPEEEAHLLQWTLFAATSVEPAALAVAMPHMRGEAATEAARAAIAEALERLRRPFGWLESHLAARPYMLGDRFTVADIVMAECVRYATSEPGVLDGWPHLKDWLARCHARPAFQKMWAARLAEPA
jgi:glutathione S-transferase